MRHVGIYVCLLFGLPSLAWAQQANPPRGRQFVQDLLKSLIDSQLPEPRQASPGAQAARSQATIERTTTPRIREAARLLTQAAEAMNGLVSDLQADVYRAQGVRQLLSEAMRVNANASVLARRLSYASDIEPLRENLRQLDQDWRALEYRLARTENLSSQTLRQIQLVKQYEEQIAGLFDVLPQVDMEAVVRHATQLTSSLRSLLEDIHFEVTDRAVATRLVADGRRVFDQAQSFVQLTQTPAVTFATVRQAFQALERDWQLFETDLQQVNNRFIQRQTQRIESSNRNLHELLRVAPELDRQDLLHSTRLLLHDLEQFMGQVTLKMLVDLPGARNFAIASTADFEIACKDFAETAEAGDDVDTLRDLYFYVHDEWDRLSTSLQGIRSPQVRTSLRDMSDSVQSIQAILGVTPDFDRSKAINVGSSIVEMATHMQVDIQQFFARPNRYPREFQTDTLQTADRFRKTADKLYAGLVNGTKLRQLKTDSDAVAAEWEALCRLMPRFSNAEQQHLVAIRREVTPNVVEMQTMLSF
jgi:hypothetical protein